MGAIRYRLRCLIRRSWPSTLGLAITVAIASGVTLALAGGAHQTITAPDRYEAAQGVATDVLVEQQDASRPMTPEIAALPSVAAVRSATFVFGGLVSEGATEPVETLVFAGSHEAFGTRMVEGREPRDVAEFAVSQRFVESSGARLGDRFRLFTIPAEQAAISGFSGELPGEPTLEAQIVGVFAGPTDLQDGYAVALFPRTLLDLGDRVGVAATQHAVALRAKSTIGDLRRELDGLRSEQPFGIEPAEIVPAQVRDAVNARGLAIGIVAAVLGLAVVAVCGQLLARQFQLDEMQVRTLAAIGMSPRQLRADPVARSGVATVAGVVLGGGAAWATSASFPLGFVDAIEPSPGSRFDPAVHLGGAALMGVLLTTWVASTLALQSRSGRAARPRSVVDGIARNVRPMSASIGVRFAFDPAAGDRSSPAWAMSGLAVVVGGVIASLIFGSTVSRVVDDRARQGQADLMIGQGGDTADESAVATLVDSPAVAAVARAGTLLVSVGPHALDVVALEPERGSIVADVLDGRLPQGPDEVALGRVSARSLGVTTGDAITATVQTDGVRVQRALTVTGLVVVPSIDGFGIGEGGLVTPAGLRELRDSVAFPTVVANLREGASSAEVKRVRMKVSGGPGSTTSAIVNLDRVRDFPYLVSATLGLLTMLSLAHHLTRSSHTRRRDIAVLKALGVGPRWVSSLHHWQATAVAFAVAIVGIPLGVVVGRRTGGAFIDRIGARSDALVSVEQIAWTFGGLVLVANLVAVLSSLRLRRRAVVRLLSDE